MKKTWQVAVTGATGFIGHQVIRALASYNEYEIQTSLVGGKRLNLLEAPDRAIFLESTKPEILIHLAWYTEHGKFWQSEQNSLWRDASVDLFQRAINTGVQRIIALGTCAEYDWTTGAATFNESSPLAPHTAYGTAKAKTCERLARIAERNQVDWCWGRVFFPFGAGDSPNRLIPLMIDACRKERVLEIGPGSTVRDFIDTRSLGAAIAALTNSDLVGTINLASGQATGFAQLAHQIQGLAGVEGYIETDKRQLGPGEPEAIVADIGRLTKDLSFEAPVTLGRGLTDLWAQVSA